MAEGSDVPPEFYFACGLTIIGSIVATSLKHLQLRFNAEPRLYTIILGESGKVKKSTAMKDMIGFFESIQLPTGLTPPRMSYGVGSAEGLVRAITDSRDGRLLLLLDELKQLVDKCNIQGSTLLAAVTSLFESTRWQNDIKNAKHSGSCDNAHLSFIGCCTKDTYKNLWSSNAIGIGLTNRLFVVLAEAGEGTAYPKKHDAQNTERLNHLRERIVGQLARIPRDGLDITPEADVLWDKWFHTERVGIHATRLDVIGFRLMSLIALTTDKTAIDAETVEVVCKILDYEYNVRRITDPIDADDKIAKLEEAIRRHLQTHRKMTRRELRNATNANRQGVWAFETALKNLETVKDIRAVGPKHYEWIGDEPE